MKMQNENAMLRRSTIALSISAMFALSTGVAFAQAAAESAPQAPAQDAPANTAKPASADTGIQEVVVTAERRRASVQTLSMAVSALGAKELETKAVSTVADLQRFTPSLSVAETGLQRYVNIRGVGQAASLPQVQGGIAYHVDGVFTRNTMNEVPYYDIERVEVLRGPQGTLSGQSSTGGALFVITQAPELKSKEGYVDLTYGNYNHRTGEAALNLPISDTVAMRAAVYSENRDSFFNNQPAPGTKLVTPPVFHPGNLARSAMRLSLLVKPNKDLQILARAETYDRRSDGYAFKSTPGDPVSVFNGIQAASVAPADPYTIDYNAPGKSDLSLKRANAEVKWNLSDNLQLRSLTSWLQGRSTSMFDTDGTGTLQTTGSGATLRDLVTSQQIDYSATGQEFNLITTGTGPLQGVLGLYYFDQQNAPTWLSNPTVNQYTDFAQTLSKAVFGQASYAFTNRLKVHAGLRYNKDKVSQSGGLNQQRAIAGSKLLPVAPTVNDSNAVTGRLTVDFQLNADQFLYATAARGYKAGGYNSAGLPSFEPEYVMSYEGGLKSSFFNKHVKTQLTVFDSEYKDYQINAFDPTINAQYVQNAGKAKIYGIEFQGQGRFGNWDMDASFSKLHSEFGDAKNGGNILLADTRYPVGNPNRGPIVVTGKRLPFAQDMTAAFGIQYRAMVGDGLLTPRVQYSYNGNQWATTVGKPFDYIPSRNSIDLRLTYEVDDWTVAGFVTNLRNKANIVGKFGGNDYYGAPREAGVKVKYRF